MRSPGLHDSEQGHEPDNSERKMSGLASRNFKKIDESRNGENRASRTQHPEDATHQESDPEAEDDIERDHLKFSKSDSLRIFGAGPT